MSTNQKLSTIEMKTLKAIELAINDYNEYYGFSINVSKFKNCISSFFPDFSSGSIWSYNDKFIDDTKTCFAKYYTNQANLNPNDFWSFFSENNFLPLN